ncbi:right-handed parallel beta-helix repeat-containing protein [Pseudogracilibacillus sp. ICA-222130]|uniref:right-handed parallel beta-helix repeat-containing protein n=1 Tax=Pseudogracilibacillus sp. ICA-222130 TaxID=3134655 RepID=UPI0030BB333E
MKRLFTIVAFSFIFLYVIPEDISAKEKTIQDQIDKAKSGDFIMIKEGEYEESIVIDKPIHLSGSKNVVITGQDTGPVITIASDNVVMEDIHIKHQDNRATSPAVLVTGHHNVLRKVHIATNHYGVQLNEANHNLLSSLHITGDKQTSIKERQHGIDLWKSHQNEIRHSIMKDVQDGIYVEKSEETTLSNNTVSHSRYGYHLMFTKNTVLEQNIAHENISGMMIMGTEGTVAKDNTLKNNQENPQSLGLLLFDTDNASIIGNTIMDNRIGIFMENAKNSDITKNNVRRNYVGMQFKEANHNVIKDNAFVANVVQAQAKDSTNQINDNYWGDHFGLDITGNNKSDLSYEVDPFFLHITNEYPPFQLLFQSPGMFFLEQLIHTPDDEHIIDSSPLMENPLPTTGNMHENQWLLFLFSLVIFIFSVIIIYMGVKVHEEV